MEKLRDKLLTADEEKTLARLAAKGDVAARNRMILSNERLVWKIAIMYAGAYADIDDLVQEGLIGLCDAIRMFDPERGLRFSTYASWHIRKSISYYLSTRSTTIHTHAYLYWKARQYRRIVENDGDTPSDDELMKLLGVTKRVLVNVKKTARIRFEGEGVSSNFKSRDKQPSESFDDKEAIESVSDALRYLDERSKEVVKMRFGIGTDKLTLDQTGQALGVTRERVRQIESKALEKLRFHLELAGVDSV